MSDSDKRIGDTGEQLMMRENEVTRNRRKMVEHQRNYDNVGSEFEYFTRRINDYQRRTGKLLDALKMSDDIIKLAGALDSEKNSEIKRELMTIAENQLKVYHDVSEEIENDSLTE